MNGKYYLTQERLDELKKELQELKIGGRIRVAERLKRAKELGDLSENSEYVEAREEQTKVESRIFELEEMFKNVTVIEKDRGGSEIVQIGSTVIISRNDQEQRFTIVGSDESKPEQGFISNESPLGQAFLGRREGEEVKVQAPAGEVAYKIVKIE